MNKIEVPDWAAEIALAEWDRLCGHQPNSARMRAAITAALGAWVVPAGHVDPRNLARLAENKTATAWPALYADADDVTLFTLRQEKPE